MLKLTSVELWLIQELTHLTHLTHTHTHTSLLHKETFVVCRAEWAELSQQQV